MTYGIAVAALVLGPWKVQTTRAAYQGSSHSVGTTNDIRATIDSPIQSFT